MVFQRDLVFYDMTYKMYNITCVILVVKIILVLSHSRMITHTSHMYFWDI